MQPPCFPDNINKVLSTLLTGVAVALNSTGLNPWPCTCQTSVLPQDTVQVPFPVVLIIYPDYYIAYTQNPA